MEFYLEFHVIKETLWSSMSFYALRTCLIYTTPLLSDCTHCKYCHLQPSIFVSQRRKKSLYEVWLHESVSGAIMISSNLGEECLS